MTFAAFLSALTGFFTFFSQVSKFIEMLRKTPQEKHDELLKRVEAIFDEKDSNGRPKWD